jgi:hypothetical protein
MRFLVIFVTCILTAAHSGSCQDDQQEVPFRDVLKSLVQERQAPKQFEVEYRLLEMQLDRIRISDEGEEVRYTGHRFETCGVVRFDEFASKLYVDSKSKLLDVFDPEDREGLLESLGASRRDKAILCISGQRIEYEPAIDRIRTFKGPDRLEREIPIDFAIFGLGSPFDVKKHTPFEDVAKRMSEWFGKWDVPIDKDGIVTVDVKNEIYKIDTERGYWPILHQVLVGDIRNGSKIKVPQESQKIELIKFKEHWLQKKVEIHTPAMTRVYEFQWLRYDEPLGPTAFDLKEIIKDRWTRKEAGKGG